MSLFHYKGKLYPEYIREGNAQEFIHPAAKRICNGRGLDIGGGAWPLPGSILVENDGCYSANNLPPGGPWDYIFSSHCLEHLTDPIRSLEYWRENIRPGGVLFLYLPHPDMEYWLPQNNRKHLHTWSPEEMAKILSDIGFYNVIHSQRDSYWSFSCVGFVPEGAHGSSHRRDDGSSRR